MQGAIQQQQQQPITSGAAPYLSLTGSSGLGDPGDDHRPDPHAGLMASLGAPAPVDIATVSKYSRRNPLVHLQHLPMAKVPPEETRDTYGDIRQPSVSSAHAGVLPQATLPPPLSMLVQPDLYVLPPELMPPGSAVAPSQQQLQLLQHEHQQHLQQPQHRHSQQQELSQMAQQAQHGFGSGSGEDFALPPLHGEGGSFPALATDGNVPM